MKNFLHCFFLPFFLFFANVAPVKAQTAVQGLVQYSATSAGGLALASDNARKYLLVQNRGAGSVYLKFDSAPSTNEGIEISAGGNYEPYMVPFNAVYLKSASASSQAITIYFGR